MRAVRRSVRLDCFISSSLPVHEVSAPFWHHEISAGSCPSDLPTVLDALGCKNDCFFIIGRRCYLRFSLLAGSAAGQEKERNEYAYLVRHIR